MSQRTIAIVGTYDTKNDELRFMEEVILAQGGRALSVDVSVLKDPASPTDISKHQIAAAADLTIEAIIAMEDENAAMQAMARGASRLMAEAENEGRIDGILLLGGTMGTDLALDVTMALPIGLPKYIVSTVAFSPLLPPERIAADVQMILWAGGLYGLNSICKAALSQAAGAVLGAANAVHRPDRTRPMIGMTSFGKTVLTYMARLKPALEARGFEVAVFHATGMGGRAFEDLAARDRFACVFDFATQEVGNHLFGSQVSAGPERMTSASQNGTPQIIAPGCHDLVDIVGWQTLDPRWSAHERHAHNRLITAVLLKDAERGEVARAHSEKLKAATGKTAFLMPLGGCHEWDRPGAPLHAPSGLAAFASALRATMPAHVAFHELDCHINDDAFSEAALRVFDEWFPRGAQAASSSAA